MGRPPTQINEKRTLHIKELLKLQNLKEYELAEKIGMPQQSFNRVLRINKVSEQTAIDIYNKYPQYRSEWILGYSDFKTDGELQIHYLKQKINEGDRLSYSFMTLAELNGFTFAASYPATNKSIESVIDAIKHGISISRNDKTVTLTLEELNSLENEICDYVEFRLLHIMKLKEQ